VVRWRPPERIKEMELIAANKSGGATTRGGGTALRLADRAALDEMHEEQDDRDNEQDVEQTAERIARHEPQEPEDQQKKY
jgi:hypothetical protein